MHMPLAFLAYFLVVTHGASPLLLKTDWVIFHSRNALKGKNEATVKGLQHQGSVKRHSAEAKNSGRPHTCLACAAAGKVLALKAELKNERSSSHLKPFYADADQDLVCFMVHVLDRNEHERLSNSVSRHGARLGHLPVASKIERSLILYQHDDLAVNTKRLKGDFINIGVNIFPNDFATKEYMANLLKGLRKFEAHAHRFRTSECISISDKNGPMSYCTSHFTIYAKRLGFKMASESSVSCGFGGIHAISISPQGHALLNIQSMARREGCVLILLFYLVSQPEITYVHVRDPVKQLFGNSNQNVSAILQSGVLSSFPFYDAAITGAGQVIGISDTGLDGNSCFFYDPTGNVEPSSSIVDPSKRKVIMYNPYQDNDDYFNGHGTFVAGCAAGKNLNDNSSTFNGVAKDAKIAFFDLVQGNDFLIPPSDYRDIFIPLHTLAGARIHSASWGQPYDNEYGIDSHNIDAFVHDYPNDLVLFAAGNQGSFGITQESNCKNCLSVGASCGYLGANDGLVDWSSVGPTSDGRIKPDVVAPGSNIGSVGAGVQDSSSQTCATTISSGTSFSTPFIAGISALLRQYLQQGRLNGYGIVNPSAALMKALLINSGEMLTKLYSEDCSTQLPGENLNPGPFSRPDMKQGFGAVKLNNIIPLDGEYNTFIYDNVSITTGFLYAFTFTVTNDTMDLRATLTWIDPPGVLGSSKQVLNDLDLSIILPNGTVVFPNYGHGPDRINNVERLIVPKALLIVGTKQTLRVSGTLIMNSPQSFALAVTGQISAPTPSPPVKTGSNSSNESLPNYAFALMAIMGAGVIALSGVIWCRWRARKSPEFRRHTDEENGNDAKANETDTSIGLGALGPNNPG